MNDDAIDETPPPADPALLAMTNRALHEQLGKARAERDEARAELAAWKNREEALHSSLAAHHIDTHRDSFGQCVVCGTVEVRRTR